jgi:hypothetical protein
MKNVRSQNPKHNIQFNTNKHRPENKDDIDSREGEEQIIKGDDVTHNKREKQSARKKVGDPRKGSR